MTASGYRIEHPTMQLVLSDMRTPASDPGPGDRVPHLDIEMLDGGRLTVDALRDDGRPLLLVFGSLTCPVTESAAMTGYADSAFESAGQGAIGDTWRAAPPFGMMIVVSRMFGFLPARTRGAAAMAVLGLAAVAIAVVAVTLLR